MDRMDIGIGDKSYYIVSWVVHSVHVQGWIGASYWSLLVFRWTWTLEKVAKVTGTSLCELDHSVHLQVCNRAYLSAFGFGYKFYWTQGKNLWSIVYMPKCVTELVGLHWDKFIGLQNICTAITSLVVVHMCKCV